MIFRESVTIIIISILGIVAAIGYASSYFLGDDNKVEEACEKVIVMQTGINIDITPNSPEQPTAEDIAEDEILKNI